MPDSGRWQTLHASSKVSHAGVRSVTLDNKRQTLGVLGYCRKDADAFELLRVAGMLAQRAFANRPEPLRIAVVVQTAQRRAAWQEALYAALAAHGFALPSDKSQPAGRKLLASVDVYGESTLERTRAERMAEANNLVRHLTSLPPNVLDAGAYRRLLATLARRHGLKLRWYSEAALARLGAGAFLAVSRSNPRRDAGIAHLTYAPRGRRGKAGRPDLALVGKGVTFDTGGANLKPHKAMFEMHIDMSGSAVALATIVAAAQLRAPHRHRRLACHHREQHRAEGLPATGSRARHERHHHTGDPQRCRGRMALADTLALAARRKPRAMLDFATLTGACVYALTERMSGLLATDDDLARRALAASAASGERLWQFPLPDDFDTDLKAQRPTSRSVEWKAKATTSSPRASSSASCRTTFPGRMWICLL